VYCRLSPITDLLRYEREGSAPKTTMSAEQDPTHPIDSARGPYKNWAGMTTDTKALSYSTPLVLRSPRLFEDVCTEGLSPRRQSANPARQCEDWEDWRARPVLNRRWRAAPARFRSPRSRVRPR
jgi:hypothetical protein